MVDFTTFDSFINSTLGETIGEGECWDYINLLWSHLGSRYYTYPPSDPSSTNHGVKWGWINEEARAANTITHLTQITSLSNVKRGDVIVISDGEYGHAAFAAEDYQGTGYLSFYSQNYNWIEEVRLDINVSMANFLGAWRYDAWQTPPHPVAETKKRFPWVLYARKLRESRL